MKRFFLRCFFFTRGQSRQSRGEKERKKKKRNAGFFFARFLPRLSPTVHRRIAATISCSLAERNRGKKERNTPRTWARIVVNSSSTPTSSRRH